MIDKLKKTEQRFLEIESMLSLPEVIENPEKSKALMKDYKLLSPIVEAYRNLCKAKSQQEEAEEILSEKPDPEMAELALLELDDAKEKQEALLEEIKILLLPKDPNDDKNVIVEIRAGAGGEEAALFSAVLYRMYSMYAQNCGWRAELIESNETELSGYKEISFMIEGEGAYSKLKFESGVHRVQRVPETETYKIQELHLPIYHYLMPDEPLRLARSSSPPNYISACNLPARQGIRLILLVATEHHHPTTTDCTLRHCTHILPNHPVQSPNQMSCCLFAQKSWTPHLQQTMCSCVSYHSG